MEKDSVYTTHILDSIKAIEDYTKGLTFENFIKSENRMIQAAVTREFQIIGEAAKRLSREVKKENPLLPWKKITGMRDKITHDYFGIDLEVVWLTLEKDLPILKKAIKELKTSEKEAV